MVSEEYPTKTQAIFKITDWREVFENTIEPDSGLRSERDIHRPRSHTRFRSRNYVDHKTLIFPVHFDPWANQMVTVTRRVIGS